MERCGAAAGLCALVQCEEEEEWLHRDVGVGGRAFAGPTPSPVMRWVRLSSR